MSLYTGYAFILAVVSIALEHKLLEKKEMAPLLHSLVHSTVTVHFPGPI